MKKSWLGCLLAVVALGMVPGMAGAQNGAVVIKDTSCTVLDLDKITTFEVMDTVKVITPSRNLNKNVSCHGDLTDGSLSVPPDKAVTFDYENTGFKCCVNFSLDTNNPNWVSTENWHQVITPSGNVSLTCHFKGNEALEPCMSSIPQ